MATTARSPGAVGFVSACAFAQLLLQFVLQVVLARHFGAGPQMDAYLAAFAVPVVLTTVLVGSLSYAFVPVFVERQRNAGEEAAWQMASTIGAGVALLSPAVALAGFLLAEPLMRRGCFVTRSPGGPRNSSASDPRHTASRIRSGFKGVGPACRAGPETRRAPSLGGPARRSGPTCSGPAGFERSRSRLPSGT